MFILSFPLFHVIIIIIDPAFEDEVVFSSSQTFQWPLTSWQQPLRIKPHRLMRRAGLQQALDTNSNLQKTITLRLNKGSVRN